MRRWMGRTDVRWTIVGLLAGFVYHRVSLAVGST